MADNLEEVHEELLEWADTIGVKIKSIRPMRISGRGFGSESIIKDSTLAPGRLCYEQNEIRFTDIFQLSQPMTSPKTPKFSLSLSLP